MSFESLSLQHVSPVEAPKAIPYIERLRTPEEVREIRRTLEQSFVLRHFGKTGHEIYLLGLQHTTDLAVVERLRGVLKPVLDTGDFGGSDLVLVEGSSPRKSGDGFSNEPEGEQQYFYSLAERHGIAARSWDVPFSTRVKESLEHHSPQAVLGFFVAQIAKILLSDKKQASAAGMAKLLEAYITPELSEDIRRKYGITLDTSAGNLQAACRAYAGRSIEELTFEDADRLADPYREGPTNAVNLEQMRSRDLHALRVLEQEKKRRRRIFISGGLDHILAWEPAIAEMYKDEK